MSAVRDLDGLATILIPTRNRPEFLERLLRLFEYEGLDSPIMLADSSDPLERGKTDAVVSASEKALQIDYLTFPVDTSLPMKFAALLERTETSHVVYVGDDDILVPGGFRTCLRELASHPDWVGVRGRIFDIHLDDVYGVFDARSEWPLTAGLQDRAVDRLAALLPGYWQTCQSVMRTELFRSAMQTVDECGFQYFFAEILHCAFPLMTGKIGIVDCLYYLHQSHSSNLANTAVWKDMLGWLSKPSWHADYEALRQRMIPTIASHDQIDAEEVAACFEAGILRTLKAWIESDLFYRKGGKDQIGLVPAPPPPGRLGRLVRRILRPPPGPEELRHLNQERIFGAAIVQSPEFDRLTRFLDGGVLAKAVPSGEPC